MSAVSDALADQDTELVNLGELHRRTAELFRNMAKTGKWLVVSDHGRFVAIIQPLVDREVVGELISSLIESGAFGDPDASVGRTFTTAELARELNLPESDFDEERDLED